MTSAISRKTKILSIQNNYLGTVKMETTACFFLKKPLKELTKNFLRVLNIYTSQKMINDLFLPK